MRLYLYLARRDKTAVNIVSVFESSNDIEATRITESTQLDLPIEETTSLQHLFDENKMEWEPWIESANDYFELKKNLEFRKYKNVPGSCKPMHSSYSYTDPYIIAAKFVKKSTMLRKPIP